MTRMIHETRIGRREKIDARMIQKDNTNAPIIRIDRVVAQKHLVVEYLIA